MNKIIFPNTLGAAREAIKDFFIQNKAFDLFSETTVLFQTHVSMTCVVKFHPWRFKDGKMILDSLSSLTIGIPYGYGIKDIKELGRDVVIEMNDSDYYNNLRMNI